MNQSIEIIIYHSNKKSNLNSSQTGGGKKIQDLYLNEHLSAFQL